MMFVDISAAADAHGIPARLVINFTFDKVHRFLWEGDPLDRDVVACTHAALADYSKTPLLLRLPGSIDIPSFDEEVMTMESLVPGQGVSNTVNGAREEMIHHR